MFSRLLNNNFTSPLLIFLVVLIYLHPALLGKVDTPIDIRDAYMYPWRYHEVDKKIKTLNLWEAFKGKVEKINVQPKSSISKIYEINLNKDILKSIKDIKRSGFYISFDLKKENEQGDFTVQLFNRKSQEVYVPPYSYSPFTGGADQNWQKAYFNLDGLLHKIKTPEQLNDYNLQLISENKSSSEAQFVIKDLELLCDDRSNTSSVKNFYINDVIQMFTPFREYYSNSLKSGRIPFWNNFTFTGTEFISEPQVGYFHPLYMTLYYIFDHFTAHTLLLFICLFLCGFGAYLLSRYWGLSNLVSLFVGIVYIFHPFNAKWLSYEHVLMNSATLPFLLLFYEKSLKENKWLNKYFILTSALTGLLFLSGHLQKVYYSLVFFFLFVLFRFVINVFIEKKNSFRYIVETFIMFGAGLLIGSVVLVPFFSLLANSHRDPFSIEFIKATSIPLKAFLGLFYPYYAGFPLDDNIDPVYKASFFRTYVYFGIIPLFFFFLSFIRITKNKLLIFFILAVVISVLVSTGSPLFYLLRNILPGFKQMQHYRFLEVYSYAVPFVSGFGFQLFYDYFSKWKGKVVNVLSIALIAVTVIDLMYFSSYFVTWSDKNKYKPVHKGGVVEFLLDKKAKSHEPFRILPFAVSHVGKTKLKINIAQPNTLMPYELEDASGYSSFVPKNLYNLFVYIQTKDPNKIYTNEVVGIFENPNIPYPVYNFKSKVLDLLNVRYFLVPKVLTLNDKNVRKVYEGDAAIYENLDYLPRAFIVTDYKVIENPKDTIVYLDSEEFNPRQTVILDHGQQTRDKRQETTDNRQQSVVRGLMSVVSFVKYESEHIKLKVQTNTAGFLVLGHNLNKNWKVKINGKEDKHFQANLVQRAVYLPTAGEYDIEFYYSSKKFIVGACMTLFGFLILLVLGIYLRGRK